METQEMLVDETESEWISETEVKESSTPLQLDMPHALWETYQGRERKPRPEPKPAQRKWEQADRKQALTSIGNDGMKKVWIDKGKQGASSGEAL